MRSSVFKSDARWDGKQEFFLYGLKINKSGGSKQGFKPGSKQAKDWKVVGNFLKALISLTPFY